jgi:cytochrome c peroxidase
MKNLTTSVTVAVTMLLAACGGDTPPAKPAPSSAPPTATPAPAAPSAKATPAPAPAGAGAAATPQDATAKPLPKARVDVQYVKAMFGRDPQSEEVAAAATPEQVALGRALYHATSWSGDGARSCATCHPLESYGMDGKPTVAAAPGIAHPRNVPTTWNAFRQFRQGWDGRATTVEQFAAVHALAPDGNALGDDATLVAKAKADAALASAFAQAFPGGDAVTAANAQQALGAFLRTLATKSKWEAWLDGDAKALGNDELYGLEQFIKVGCTSCHGTRLVGGNMMQKTGAVKPYPSSDLGRMALTKSDADKSMFKVPSLMNVEKTAPYMHDGSKQTLEEMVRLMLDIQLAPPPQPVTPEQVRGIVAFLKAMTGPLPAAAASQPGK